LWRTQWGPPLLAQQGAEGGLYPAPGGADRLHSFAFQSIVDHTESLAFVALDRIVDELLGQHEDLLLACALVLAVDDEAQASWSMFGSLTGVSLHSDN
jgi:hypothetical protein